MWEFPRNLDQPPLEEEHHETVKPTFILREIVRHATEKGDIILDPFAGTGSTAVVAKQMGRHYICIEIEENYCKMAKRRLNFGERLEKFGFEFV